MTWYTGVHTCRRSIELTRVAYSLVRQESDGATWTPYPACEFLDCTVPIGLLKVTDGPYGYRERIALRGLQINGSLIRGVPMRESDGGVVYLPPIPVTTTFTLLGSLRDPAPTGEYRFTVHGHEGDGHLIPDVMDGPILSVP